jgi:hypothetical protein
MNSVRNVLAVIAGYAVFVISTVLLFQLTGIDPHADPSIGIIALTIIYGVVFSFLGGLLAQLISGAGRLTINYVLAVIMAGFAVFSLFKASGNHYSQWAAIFLFAPASLFGGKAWLKKMKK